MLGNTELDWMGKSQGEQIQCMIACMRNSELFLGYGY